MGMSAQIILITLTDVGRLIQNVVVTFLQQPTGKDVDTANSSADIRVSFFQLPKGHEDWASSGILEVSGTQLTLLRPSETT